MTVGPAIPAAHARAAPGDEVIDRFQVVDCLLPGKVRQLGRNMRFIDRRRPARLPAGDCEIRGGEYTVHDRAETGESFNVWMPLAMEGDANAQLIVGELSERGETPDYGMARLWYERAAGQGNSAAMFNLARLYEEGLGVEADDEAASSWLRQAYGLSANRLDDVVRIERLEGEVATLSGTVETLRNELAEARAEKQALEQKLREQEAALSAATADVAALTETLSETRRATARAASAYESKLAELRSRSSELDRQETVIASTENSLAASLETLATRQSEATARLFEAVGKLPSLAAQSGRLAAMQSELKAAKARARALEAERQTALEAKRAATAEVAKSRAALQAELAALADREAELSAREEALARELAAVQQSSTEGTTALDMQSRQIAEQQRKLADEREAVKAHLALLDRSRRAQESREAALSQAEADLRAEREAIAAREAELEQLSLGLTQKAKSLEATNEAEQAALARVEAEYGEIAAERERIESDRRQLMALRDELADTSVQVALTERELADRTADIAARTADLEAREQAANLRESEIEQLRRDAEEARAKLAALEQIISGGMRSAGAPGASQAGQNEVRPIAQTRDWNIQFGEYHAILIGNANYEDPNWIDLDTPHNDVNRIGDILRTRYGFNTNILIDATRDEILTAIEDAKARLGNDDNLLIYFAGHGKQSDGAQVGFWEPVDSVAHGFRNSISAQDINLYLSTMAVRKVLVVSDSCYSGVFARDMVAQLDPNAEPSQQEKFFMIQAAKRSRVVMTAGGLKPVVDSIGNGHSLFASSFINALLENDDIALSRNLFGTIRDNVVRGAAQLNLDQEPVFADLVHTGHEGGDFIFVPNV